MKMHSGVKRFIDTWPIGVVLGCTLFWVGIVLLRHNPVLAQMPWIPTSYFVWNAVAHLVSTAGLICGFLSVLNGISTVVTHKRLFWFGMLAILVTALVTWGPGRYEDATFSWNERDGFRNFRVKNVRSYFSALVRWQVEPELDSYFKATQVESTEGEFRVHIGTIVPAASASFDECWHCMGNTVWKNYR